MKTSLATALLIAAAIIIWKFDQHVLTPPDAGPPLAQHSLAGPHPDPKPIHPSASDPITAPDAEEDDDPFEMVLGIEVRKDRNCTVEVREITDLESGVNRSVFSCTPDSLNDIDPYTTYSNEVLAGMAYGDPHAAEILGLRKLVSTDPKLEAEGLKLLLRAVALSNSTRGIALAVNTKYSHISTDDQIHLDNVSQLYVLSQISNTVTPGSMATDRYSEMLKTGGMDAEAIDQLRHDSQEILNELAGVQTEITGNTDIREALEDA